MGRDYKQEQVHSPLSGFRRTIREGARAHRKQISRGQGGDVLDEAAAALLLLQRDASRGGAGTRLPSWVVVHLRDTLHAADVVSVRL